MVPEPEQEARKQIDRLLTQAGWVVWGLLGPGGPCLSGNHSRCLDALDEMHLNKGLRPVFCFVPFSA